MSVSDEALVAGMASSDHEAAAAFVRRYQRRVFGLALAVLGDRDAASDVAQEAFVRVWRHAAVFDAQRGNVSTWLLTITRNLALDALRLRRAVPVDPVVLATLDVPAGEPLPGGEVVLPAELQRLRAALAALPAEQRRAFLLAAYGLSAREIGERDDVPLGTVKTRIRTAHLRLRSSLEVPDA